MANGVHGGGYYAHTDNSQVEFYAHADFPSARQRGSVRTMKMDQKVRAIRRATGWQQQKLADHFKVSQSTVNRWLAGADPRGEHRDQINAAYDELVANRPGGVAGDDWLGRIEKVFARLEGAPPSLFQQIVNYAEGVADTFEKMRDTAVTPQS
jgi:transcriptional regulator with XRE-family HTH domain